VLSTLALTHEHNGYISLRLFRPPATFASTTAGDEARILTFDHAFSIRSIGPCEFDVLLGSEFHDSSLESAEPDFPRAQRGRIDFYPHLSIANGRGRLEPDPEVRSARLSIPEARRPI